MVEFVIALFGFFLALFGAVFVGITYYNKPRTKANKIALVQQSVKYSVIGTIFVFSIALLSPLVRDLVVRFASSDRPGNSSFIRQYARKHRFPQDSSIHVLVLPFGSFGNISEASRASRVLADYVSQELRGRAKEYSVLALESDSASVRTHKQALEWGAAFNADVVLWGIIDPPLAPWQKYHVQPRATLVSPIRAVGSTINFETLRNITPRPLAIDFPKQVVEAPYQVVRFLIAYRAYTAADYDAAIQGFQNAARAWPDSSARGLSNVWYYVGSAHFLRAALATGGEVTYVNRVNRDLEIARAAFDTALALDPDNIYALNGIGAIYFQQYNPNYDSAALYFKRVLRADSSALFAHGNLANAFIATGKPDSALIYLNRELHIVRNASGFPEFYEANLLLSLGNIYTMMDSLPRAEQFIRASLAGMPPERAAGAIANLGGILLEQGRRAEAKLVLIDGVRKWPTEPSMNEALAHVYIEQGDYQQSRKFLARARVSSRPEQRATAHFATFASYCLDGQRIPATVWLDRFTEYRNVPTAFNGPTLLEALQSEERRTGSLPWLLDRSPLCQELLASRLGWKWLSNSSASQ